MITGILGVIGGRAVQVAQPDPTELIEHKRIGLYLAVRIKNFGLIQRVRQVNLFWHNENGEFGSSHQSIAPQRKERACVMHAGVCCNLVVFSKLFGVGSCNLHDPTPFKVKYVQPELSKIFSTAANTSSMLIDSRC